MSRWGIFLAWVTRVWRSRYVLLLEEEVERLRAENRALVNSLLGTAGVPPLEFPDTRRERAEVPRLRRRSWHQIQFGHEIEEGRKARHAAEASAAKATGGA